MSEHVDDPSNRILGYVVAGLDIVLLLIWFGAMSAGEAFLGWTA